MPKRAERIAGTTSSVVVGIVPDFLVGVGLVYVFGVNLGWFPVAGNATPEAYVLPVLALAIGPAAILARIIRVEMVSVLEADFVRTARAKRLPARTIYLGHALPNALTASLTLGGLLLSAMVAGTVLVSAMTGFGLETLRVELSALLASLWEEIDVFLPYTAGDLLARVRERGTIEVEYRDRDVRVRGRVAPGLAAELRGRAVDGTAEKGT